MSDIGPRMGVYRHYKGALYQVVGIAQDANAADLLEADGRQDGMPFPNDERTVVLYFPVDHGPVSLGLRLTVRTLEDFEAVLHPDGTVCAGERCTTIIGVTGRAIPRFKYLGPWFTADMLTPEKTEHG